MQVGLGDRVKDRIDGLTGIVIGRASYLYGCRQVLIAHEKLGEKGERQKGEWLDEDRVELVVIAVHETGQSAAERAGGPLTEPAPPVR